MSVPRFFSWLSNISVRGWALGLSDFWAAMDFAVLDIHVQVFMWTLFSFVLNRHQGVVVLSFLKNYKISFLGLVNVKALDSSVKNCVLLGSLCPRGRMTSVC